MGSLAQDLWKLVEDAVDSVVLEKGAKGKLVKALQGLLNVALKEKPPLAEDGDFGQATDGAVRRFQRRAGLSVDGKAGPLTWGALIGKKVFGGSTTKPSGTGPVATGKGKLPVTEGMTEEDQYKVYLQYFESVQAGKSDISAAKQDLADGKQVILGLRVITGRREYEWAGKYDDRIVLLWIDGDGNKRVKAFEANTEPATKTLVNKGSYGVDANKDGIKDYGRLPEGIYLYRKYSSKKYPQALRPRHDIYVDRDTNQDGYFDDKDTYTRLEGLNSGTTMLFHPGKTNRVSSAGCQTMHPNVWAKFWKSLNFGGQNTWRYVLVHAARVPQPVSG